MAQQTTTFSPTLISWLNKGRYLRYGPHQIFYIDEGEGEPLLILHGYPYSSLEWHSLLPALTGQYRIITFDYLGMGFSDKPRRHRFTYEEYTGIVQVLFETLQIKKVHLLAHDLGVSVAQELVARQQEKQLPSFTINSVAFVNGGLFMHQYKPRFIQRLLSQSPSWLGYLVNQAIGRRLIEKTICSLFGRQTQPDRSFLNDQWYALTYKKGKSISYRIGRLVFDKYTYQQRWIGAMQDTDIPLCFINGPADPNSGRAMAELYTKLIPHPKVYLLPDHIGHWPHIEDPSAFLNAYLHFRRYVNGCSTKSFIKSIGRC